MANFQSYGTPISGADHPMQGIGTHERAYEPVCEQGPGDCSYFGSVRLEPRSILTPFSSLNSYKITPFKSISHELLFWDVPRKVVRALGGGGGGSYKHVML
jgi:hypothetical protein